MEIGQENNDAQTAFKSGANDLRDTSLLHLSIVVGYHRFGFALINKQEEKCFHIYEENFQCYSDRELIEKLKTIYKNQPLLAKNYSSSTLAFSSSYFTLVPNVFLNGNLEKHLLFSNKEIPHANTVSNNIDRINASLVYHIPKEINAFIFESFNGVELISTATTFLVGSLNQSIHTPTVFVYIEKEQIMVLIAKGRDIKLLNSYKTKTKEDVLYYLLFAMEQSEMSHKKTPVILSGNLQPDDQLHVLLKKFLGIISFLRLSVDNSTTNGYESYRYPMLLNQHLCV